MAQVSTGTYFWLIVAVACGVLEVVSGATLTALFFAAGALLAAVVAWWGPWPHAWAPALTFVAGSVGTLLLVRRRLLAGLAAHRLGAPVPWALGKSALLRADAAPGAVVAATLHGSRWSARNVGMALLPRGSEARIVGVEGLTLLVVAQALATPPPVSSSAPAAP